MNNKMILLWGAIWIALQASAQVGIGTKDPHKAAMLDVVATDKGILIPRVLLSSVIQVLNVNAGAQPHGLLVYNEGGSLAEGFYFWDGAEWKNIASTSALPPSITTLLCDQARLEPSTFKAGQAYSGLLRIPYTGGNGGKYSVGPEISPLVGSNLNSGLKIRLKAGQLEYGNGELVYDVYGTPTADSPTPAMFRPEFAGIFCEVTVGNVQAAISTSIAVVGPLEATSDNGVVGYHKVVKSPDGKFSVRLFARNGITLQNSNLQIQSNMGPVTIIWNSLVAWYGGVANAANSSFSLSQKGIWYGGTSPSESVVSNNATGWGDPNVYYNGAPEQCRYMWTTTDVTDKTVYILSFIMGAPASADVASATSAANTKIFLRIEQIHAE